MKKIALITIVIICITESLLALHISYVNKNSFQLGLICISVLCLIPVIVIINHLNKK